MITVKQLESQLKRRIRAPATKRRYLAVGGPYDGKVMPLSSPETLVGLWRVQGQCWYGGYQYYNTENYERPKQVGHGLPLVFWRSCQ